ncbi:MAG TPA: helix-turn-helix domain-containing protein [Longimicrobiales bacterium]|nr:helix-turn-helix domain-containing protein [Longimicrobiales bacterium]
MEEGLTVRAAGQRIGVHKDTAWRWRHRLLAGLRARERELLQERVDLGQALFPHSEKGARTLGRSPYPRRQLDPDRPNVRVLFARDAHARTLAAILSPTPLSRPTEGELRAHLLPRLAPLCVLRSVWGGYQPIAGLCRPRSPQARGLIGARQLSFAHRGRSRVIPAYRVELRRWLRRFHGISSRYLANYLHWFRLIDPSEAESDARRVLRVLCA